MMNYFFLSGSHKTSTKIIQNYILEECLLLFWQPYNNLRVGVDTDRWAGLSSSYQNRYCTKETLKINDYFFLRLAWSTNTIFEACIFNMWTMLNTHFLLFSEDRAVIQCNVAFIQQDFIV